MFLLDENERQMLRHVVDEVKQRMSVYDGYTESDEEALTKLSRVAEGSVVIVLPPAAEIGGTFLDTFDRDKTLVLMQQVIRRELDNWVPSASQRLLYRAGLALGQFVPRPLHPECPDTDHATIMTSAAGIPVDRCVVCGRIWEVQGVDPAEAISVP